MSGHGNLVRMANRIGQFFEAYPDEQEALEGIANHIEKFWEPRMRRQLLDFLDAHPDGRSPGEESLRPLVFKAVSQHRVRLSPGN
ncbi:formate dehydrogenase subunit delta [Paracandidimonas soli]|uniref:Formate dehydrogenase subunit delta n=1 Tax=Paracandidimonas soli TaxID=1917182 RepID=A0A4R3V734_9BURK|nr:formate dehydrogenase subunit delta [Paracandidimonas soli]TCU99178.1 formate dehydrogenase subunit delta [Paracandidimonas soli]